MVMLTWLDCKPELLVTSTVAWVPGVVPHEV